MDTKNTKAPWNENYGLHEGDMAHELASHEHNMFAVPLMETLDYWVTKAAEHPDFVRQRWYETFLKQDTDQ